MSTFPGPLPEVDGVWIDVFKPSRCTAYFLSHAHSDHMVGLDDEVFASHLRRFPHTKVYMSKVTFDLLKDWKDKKGVLKYGRIIDRMEWLDGGSEHEIPLDPHRPEPKRFVTVQLLPSAHCPGSVMFLFTQKSGASVTRVLYTGDFRLETGDIEEDPKLLPLRRLRDAGIRLDALHVDTTFCRKDARFFPSRRESADALVSVTRSWLSRAPENAVFLKLAANFGHEFLLVELSKHIPSHGPHSRLVHVSEVRAKQYSCIPDIASLLTTDPTGARIHVACGCFLKGSKLRNVKFIKPSAMFFTMRPEKETAIVQENALETRVCYSMHSSMDEIRELIEFLKPKKVSANVAGGNDKSEILETLKEIHETALRVTKSTSSELPLQNQDWTRESLPISPRRKRAETTKSTEDSDGEREENASTPVNPRVIRRNRATGLQAATVKREAEKLPKLSGEPVVKKKPLSLSQEEKAKAGFVSSSVETAQSAPSNLCLDAVEEACPIGASEGEEQENRPPIAEPAAASPPTCQVEQRSDAFQLVEESLDTECRIPTPLPKSATEFEEGAPSTSRKNCEESPGRKDVGAKVETVFSSDRAVVSCIERSSTSSEVVEEGFAVRKTVTSSGTCGAESRTVQVKTEYSIRSNKTEVSVQHEALSSSTQSSKPSKSILPSCSRVREHPSSSPEVVEERLSISQRMARSFDSRILQFERLLGKLDRDKPVAVPEVRDQDHPRKEDVDDELVVIPTLKQPPVVVDLVSDDDDDTSR